MSIEELPEFAAPGSQPQCDVVGCILESRAVIHAEPTEEESDKIEVSLRICLPHATMFELLSEGGRNLEMALPFLYALCNEDVLHDMIAFHNDTKVEEIAALCQPIPPYPSDSEHD